MSISNPLWQNAVNDSCQRVGTAEIKAKLTVLPLKVVVVVVHHVVLVERLTDLAVLALLALSVAVACAVSHAL